jgi:hypothetical protein
MAAVTDPEPAPATAVSPRAPGRGLVIVGSILVGLYLLPAVVLIGWFLWGLAADAGAMGMVFPFWLMALLILTPLWIVGIALLGAGRTRQRGSVKGVVPAWILAVGGMPAIGVLLTAAISLLSSGQDSLGGAAFVLMVIGIPVLTVLALLSGAWLTWGKTRTA